jgi:hypothetical protein
MPLRPSKSKHLAEPIIQPGAKKEAVVRPDADRTIYFGQQKRHAVSFPRPHAAAARCDSGEQKEDNACGHQHQRVRQSRPSHVHD